MFVAPGEVFDYVRATPACTANWLVPALLLILVGWIGTALVFSQEPIRMQLRELTEQAIDKSLKGMPEQQAAQARETAVKYAAIAQQITGYGFTVVIGVAWPFLIGGFMWLVGNKALKGSFTYMKAVEAAGLSNMLLVLNSVLTTLLILVMGSIYASPSLGLLVKNFDPQNNPAHVLLATVNIMTFWVLIVRSIGLARLSKASMAKAAAWFFGAWLLWTGLSTGSSLLLKALMTK